MFIPLWFIAVVVALLVARSMFVGWAEHIEERTIRDIWQKLPRVRRAEILRARERIHRGALKEIATFDTFTDVQLDQAFENAFRNAKIGEPWALRFLYEQVQIHRGMQKASPVSPLTGPGASPIAPKDDEWIPADDT
ncbi:hypothetical protein [Myxococcus xanthus]|uniref:hypothetical protein n=1 Tax=Myxococcus xanthus TaxID=34 RepID=UPI00112AF898|nr:hypothetical protein [Myxococcus xanthus]QDE83339.1 hypothetical protein BHS07_18220 [Myxococcus xanthus]